MFQSESLEDGVQNKPTYLYLLSSVSLHIKHQQIPPSTISVVYLTSVEYIFPPLIVENTTCLGSTSAWK